MWPDLAEIDPHFAYTGARTRYIRFPLGGIGSGGFSVSGSGRLVDWSIRNRPALQGYNGYSHFAIKAEHDGKVVDARVLNGPYDEDPSGGPGLRPMFDGFGHGAMRQSLVGLPHFRKVDFYGRFPTADLVFSDERFPGVVRMTALSPFMPHRDRDSSMPVGTRGDSRGCTSARLCRRPVSAASAAKRRLAGASGSTTDSSRVFQASHPGQRPCHLGSA